MLKTKFKKIQSKKILITVLLLATIITGFSVIKVFGTTTDILIGTDTVDDIKCWDLEEFEGFELDFDDFDAFMDLWEWGDLSATPDCIDITTVYLYIPNGDSNVILEINVEGDPEACLTMLMIQINCSGDDGGQIAIVGMNLGEFAPDGFPEDAGYYGVSDNDGEGCEGIYDFSNDDFRVAFPKDWLSENTEDCCIDIILMAVNPYVDILCADIFQDCNWGVDDSNGDNGDNGNGDNGDNGNGDNGEDNSITFPEGNYAGDEPITDILDDFGEFIFGAMCGSLPFIFLVMILLVIQKILADRNSLILDCLSLIPAFFAIYTISFYALSINLAEGVIFDFNIIGLLTVITLFCFMLYSLLSGLHAFDIVGNNSWCFSLGFAMQFVIGILYLTPFYIFVCPNSILSMVIEILLAVGLLAGLRISQKYSSKKGGTK